MTIVSVIVPVYNQAKHLESALESVRSQIVEEWECIVINDGSTDASEKVIRRYTALDPRFRYVYQKNRGVAAARNLGLERAHGRYVLFLDGDDSVYSHMLKVSVDVLEKDDTCGVVYGGYDMADEAGNIIRTVRAPICRREHCVERLLVANLFPCNAAIVRKATIQKSGVRFPEEARLEDWVFWLYLALEGVRFRSVEKIVCCYRRQSGGRSSHVMENTQGAERVLTKAIEIAADRHGISSDFQHVVFAALYLRRYLDAVKFEDDDAKRYCKRKLEDLNWLRVLGLSRYHLYILGLYLDIQEATGEYPFIGPIALARKLGRNVVGRFNRGMEE